MSSLGNQPVGKALTGADMNPQGVSLPTGSTAVTQADTDNTTKIATTAWVRLALAAIATAAGFAISLAVNGYIKFPSWLGGWIVQWGIGSASTSGLGAAITFPIAFPAAARQVLVSTSSSSTTIPQVGFNGTTPSGFNAICATGSPSFSWIAIGN